MTGLSRRQFLATTAALAAATGLSAEVLGPRLAAAAQLPGSTAGLATQRGLATRLSPAEVPTTLLQTIRQGSVVTGQYRALTTGPGEPYIPRLDVLHTAPDPDRVRTRRSLLYMGHLSDLHVIDAQSPGRIEPMIVQDHASWGSAFHPHDPLSVHATAAMVKAFSDARYSPLTGAPMGAAIVTGDSADMHSNLELRWYIDLMDGGSVDPASAGRTFQGVQAWSEAQWAYRPGDPTGGPFGDYGFPHLPDLLAQAIERPVESPGLPAPWFAVYGNHDTLLLGTFTLSPQLHALAVGGQKAYTLEATATNALGGYAASTSPLQQALDALGLNLGKPGFRSVTANPERFLFEQRDFMTQHFQTQQTPGPVGHGFTQHNLDSGETWWKADLSPLIRGFGLDTCNQVAGPDGAIPDDQFRWLEAELVQARKDRKLVLIFSHHNSLTLENRAQRPGDTQTLHGADEFVALLLRFPEVIGWLNGHTHLNQILAHTPASAGLSGTSIGAGNSTGTGNSGPLSTGFWEITTASCIDFPQQQQVVEIVDNQDGTLSLFTTVLDHASPAVPGTSGSVSDLASRSREFAANDWAETPMMRRGSPLDRNTELLVEAPFDLSEYSDAALEKQHLAETARLVAYEKARGL